jgi:hypothetical protein
MAHPENQKLIRCQLKSPSGRLQTRFIEFELFKLWQYMIQTKHGFEISGLRMSLWISEDDYLSKQSLYERSGDIVPVDKLTVSIFDQRNGFTHITHRFAHQDDTAQVKSILLSHVPEDLINSPDFSLEMTAGRTVERGPISGLSEISLGLSND